MQMARPPKGCRRLAE